MKNLLSLIFLTFICLISCTDNEEVFVEEVVVEIMNINDLTNEEAAELIRHNLLEQYGGAFKMLELYHNEVFDNGIDCDTTLEMAFNEEVNEVFELVSLFDVSADCTTALGVYNDRIYSAFHQSGRQISFSNLFELDTRIDDVQYIAGNSIDNVYTYSHILDRQILITKGIAAELNPSARLNILIPTCSYNMDTKELLSKTILDFSLSFNTSQVVDSTPVSDRLEFEGTIELVNDQWVANFSDGSVVVL